MKARSLWVIVMAAGLAGGTTVVADTYQIDAQHTTIGFSIKHLVINNVKGQFKEFSGTIQVEGQDSATASTKAVIKAASIDTGIKMRDDHLRGPEFFDVAKFADITFVSKRIERNGANYVAIGDLTMHGVTKEIALPFTVSGPIVDPWGKSRVGVEAGITINRQDYGINYNKTLDSGGLMLGNDVKIEINLEAVKQ